MEVLNLKRVAKIVLIGVCFGLILLFLKIIFRIDDAAFMHGYWIAAVAIVLGAVLINVCYNLIYSNKVKKFAKLLSEYSGSVVKTKIQAFYNEPISVAELGRCPR